jgi:hypothetical protein
MQINELGARILAVWSLFFGGGLELVKSVGWAMVLIDVDFGISI